VVKVLEEVIRADLLVRDVSDNEETNELVKLRRRFSRSRELIIDATIYTDKGVEDRVEAADPNEKADV
jgi:hypothetical protein